jgi:hypothetical protein
MLCRATAASGTTTLSTPGASVHHGAGMKDYTERTRVRQSVKQNKLVLTICALLAAVGFIGWLTTL